MSAKLPLDDSRWLPLIDAHARLGRRIGNLELAARDLTEKMARRRDHVRSVRRRIAYGTGPDHELLSWPFWAEHKLYYGHHRSALLIVLQSPGTSQIITAHAARGFAFFVWGPDLERHWPGICPELAPKAKQDDDGPQVTFAKELLQEKFPGGEWRTMRPTAAYHAVEELAENHGRPMPGVDSFSRALGRRKKPI